jgi:hypothetical protein
MAIEFNLGSLFGGDTTTGINALLNADQRRLMGQQANLSAASALLAASGPSRQRVGLGQALGSALQAGQQGYQQARAGSLQELMLGEKLREAQRLGQYQTALSGAQTPAAAAPAMEPLSPAMASLVSQTAPTSTAGPVGPTTQRAAIMDAAQVAPPVPPMPSKADARFDELMRKADVANQFNRPEDAQKFLDQAYKIKPVEEFSTTPQFGMSSQGTPISFVLSKSGSMRLLDVQRNPEFNYQDTGSFISVRDKNTNRELERIPKTMTPGEVASNRIAQGQLGVAQGNLGVAQGNLALSQRNFERGAFQIKETPEGFAYVPTAPGGAAVPVIGSDGKPVKGAGGGQPTGEERKAATLLSRMQLAQTQMDQGSKGMPGFLTSVTPRLALPEERKKVEDAQMDFLDAALTLATGAAYTEFQLKGAMQSYFPKFGDSADVLADKELRRQNLLEAARLSAGRMGGSVPALPAATTPQRGGAGGNRPSLNNIFGVQ